MISANGVSVGPGCARPRSGPSPSRMRRTYVTGLSLEATRGNLSIVDPVVAAAKPVPGQQLVDRAEPAAAPEAASSASGRRLRPGPLSFRVVPQVHGAFREVVGFARDAVEGELAGMGGDPLVSLADDRMISNGNFHPMLMALAMDAIRPAATHVGQLSDRRVGHLWDGLVAGTGPARTRRPRPLRGARRSSDTAGAARTAELRTLAGPASLDVGPLDLGVVEDHARERGCSVVQADRAGTRAAGGHPGGRAPHRGSRRWLGARDTIARRPDPAGRSRPRRRESCPGRVAAPARPKRHIARHGTCCSALASGRSRRLDRLRAAPA